METPFSSPEFAEITETPVKEEASEPEVIVIDEPVVELEPEPVPESEPAPVAKKIAKPRQVIYPKVDNTSYRTRNVPRFS